MGGGNVLEENLRVFTCVFLARVFPKEISEVFAAGGKDELVRLEDLGLSDEVYVCQEIFLKHKQYFTRTNDKQS